tara:strand:- start:378 stop:545 length:168 start_codon:yes stop_codon:yes gene_type:complete
MEDIEFEYIEQSIESEMFSKNIGLFISLDILVTDKMWDDKIYTKKRRNKIVHNYG